MEKNKTDKKIIFKAPWCRSLKLTSLISTTLLLGISIFGILNSHDKGAGWITGMVLIPFCIIIAAALLMVCGYELLNNDLLIRRLLWKTRISLKGLEGVEICPEAMKESIRTFGNGGLFSFSGKFRNKKLGGYHAFATNPDSSVILRLTEKVIVITPDNPDMFTKQIKAHANAKKADKRLDPNAQSNGADLKT